MYARIIRPEQEGVVAGEVLGSSGLGPVLRETLFKENTKQMDPTCTKGTLC